MKLEGDPQQKMAIVVAKTKTLGGLAVRALIGMREASALTPTQG